MGADGAEVGASLLAGGQAGLVDRSSRPHTSPGRIGPEVEQMVVDARRRCRAEPTRIAVAIGVAERTVIASCHQIGNNLVVIYT